MTNHVAKVLTIQLYPNSILMKEPQVWEKAPKKAKRPIEPNELTKVKTPHNTKFAPIIIKPKIDSRKLNSSLINLFPLHTNFGKEGLFQVITPP